jgi:XRE family aerobic/anaerobic benzoate catabolism transcriptional regulator
MGAGAGEGPGGPAQPAGEGSAGAAEAALLGAVGARVRARRLAAGLTQAGLAQQAGVSVRFLVALEAGQGNISLGRLWGVCAALRAPLAELLAGLGPGGKEKVALVGLRGAGKSSLGRALAAARGWPFVELDRKVEEAAGMRLGELFELRGEAHFRALEARALDALLDPAGPMVIATGGSIVTAPETWARLRAGARTAWLKASPAAHLARVQAQGDLRPMQGRPEALAELTALWTERAPLYGQADLTVDTDLGQDSALRALLGWASG